MTTTESAARTAFRRGLLASGIAVDGLVPSHNAAVAAEMFGLAGLGGILGTLYTAAGVGGLIGPPLAGLLIDLSNGYRLVIVLAAGLSFAAFLCLLPIKPVVPTPLNDAK